jgi:hypothetical protein
VLKMSAMGILFGLLLLILVIVIIVALIILWRRQRHDHHLLKLDNTLLLTRLTTDEAEISELKASVDTLQTFASTLPVLQSSLMLPVIAHGGGAQDGTTMATTKVTAIRLGPETFVTVNAWSTGANNAGETFSIAMNGLETVGAAPILGTPPSNQVAFPFVYFAGGVSTGLLGNAVFMSTGSTDPAAKIVFTSTPGLTFPASTGLNVAQPNGSIVFLYNNGL